MTSPQVLSYLLQTYVSDGNIAGTKDDIATLTQLPIKIELQYTEELVA